MEWDPLAIRETGEYRLCMCTAGSTDDTWSYWGGDTSKMAFMNCADDAHYSVDLGIVTITGVTSNAQPTICKIDQEDCKVDVHNN